MRLFLSSQDFGLHVDRALKMVGENKRVASIYNARDDDTPAVRSEVVQRKKVMFEGLGFVVEELDLRDYFGDSAGLDKKLDDYGMVWANGGNTFLLRRAMRASGFDEIIKKRLLADSIMYGGSSAGSCVCAPSLHGIEYGDRPSPTVVPDNYPDKSIIWDGLGLVPFMIVPHCDQERFSSASDDSVAALQKQGTECLKLNDGEVVIVDGDKLSILQPVHAATRYRPLTQKPYCCVPTSLQIVLERNGIPKPSQEEIGNDLGLVVPSEYADKFEAVTISDTPAVGSGFGTRIQDPNYGLDRLIQKRGWPFELDKQLASTILDTTALRDVLMQVEASDGDALLCYQNDRGYGHVVVFDRVIDGKLRFIDPSPDQDKWRLMDFNDMFARIKKHGDDNFGGVWLLDRA